ncbi:MAG: hypothetical protein WCK15_20240 [Pirellula sp.]
MLMPHSGRWTRVAESLAVNEQTIRNNMKPLETLDIVERVSDKQRDKNALYRFKSK